MMEDRNVEINISRVIAFFILVASVWAFVTAGSHLRYNIDLITTLMSSNTSKVPIGTADDAWTFFYVSFGMLVASIFTFFFVAHNQISSKNLPTVIRDALYWIIAVLSFLTLFGYCTHVSMIDPLYSMCRGGNPCYTFSMAVFSEDNVAVQVLRNILTNPFLYPSVSFLIGAAMLSILTPLISHFWLSSNRQKTKNKSILIYAALFACGVVFFLLISSGVIPTFLRGFTPLEVPKSLIIVSGAGLFSFFAKAREFKKDKMGLGLLAAIVLTPIFVFPPLAGDLGALMIVMFAAFLIYASTIANRFLPLLGFFLYFLLFLGKRQVDLSSFNDRFQDWQVSDIFITSGRGLYNIADTASSPDIARAHWGIASGGWFGRDSALFVDNSKNVYSAIMQYGHNDRIASVILESYGFFGLTLILGVYLLLLFVLLRLYSVSQKGVLPGFGATFGVAALMFGQVMVHIGGNFNFIPFTGIVLPFLSHGGTSFLVYLSLFVFLIALYVSEPKKHTFELSKEQLQGLKWYILLSFAFLLLYTVNMTWTGKQIATRIRYDVQGDLSVKPQSNPRLYLLFQMEEEGVILDRNQEVIRDGKGNYPKKGFDETDYFLHRFEQEHYLSLHGFVRESTGDVYYQHVCDMPDGGYHQFSGVSKQGALENQRKYFERRKYSTNPLENGLAKHCIVTREKRGTFYNSVGFGVPVEASDMQQGCQLDGESYFNTEEYQVLFYNAEEASTARLFAADSSNPRPRTIRSPRSFLFGLMSQEQELAQSCWVRKLYTDVEQRSGTQTTKGCVVQERDYETEATTVYTATSIDEEPVESFAHILSINIENQDEERCQVSLQKVACQANGRLHTGQRVLDLDNRIARESVYYGRDNRLSFSDHYCTVKTDEIGDIRFKNNVPDLQQKSFERIKATDDSISLYKYIQSPLLKQQELQSALAEKVQETKLTIGFHGDLQAGVRTILTAKLEELEAPAIQALVFDVQSGDVLSQAQVTRVREEKAYQALLAAGRYQSLYYDQGEYGYGKNTLAVKYTPGSVFKIYHAMAAMTADQLDFEHECSGADGYQPEEAEWKTPIICYGGHQHLRSNGTRGPLKIHEAISQSCNQYFAALALEQGTHPTALQALCRDKGLYFGYNNNCALSRPDTKSAGMNGYGEALAMDVYQIAAFVQALSNNQKPTLNPQEYLYDTEEASDAVPVTLFPFSSEGMGTILKGMRGQRQAKALTRALRSAGVRVYGKTGTGERELSYFDHRQERQGTYITKKTKKTTDGFVSVWREYYERPYGVTNPSNTTLFVALLEDSSLAADQVGVNRIAIVVRVPRSGKDGKITGASIAYPIAKDIALKLVELDLIPKEGEE